MAGTNLLANVTRATAAAKAAERKRVEAIRAAKESREYTVEQIAEAADLTRDGVYKMLARTD